MNTTVTNGILASAPRRLGERILVVDDEPHQMQALCDTLRDEGYEVTGFLSGAEALVALRKGQEFDLLLSDLAMPEMSGIELLQAALKMDPRLVGIIMTGEGTVASAVEAMKVGAMDYILKPFKLSAIEPVLRRALTVRRLQVENAFLQAQLREHAAELEAANTELAAFSISVSHDLRAPLRVMNGSLSILILEHAGSLNGEARHCVEMAQKSVDRMSHLIEDLLRLSQLGRQPLSCERVDMAALVQEVLEELRQDPVNQRHTVVVGELPDCHGDPSLLRQVVTNLLSNAFKFSRKMEQPRIEIGAVLSDRKAYFVRDNGEGFDMKYADKLFGTFQRLHSEREFEGSGVGLSIARRIIERHGGAISATSAPSQGAVFRFTLPQ